MGQIPAPPGRCRAVPAGRARTRGPGGTAGPRRPGPAPGWGAARPPATLPFRFRAARGEAGRQRPAPSCGTCDPRGRGRPGGRTGPRGTEGGPGDGAVRGAAVTRGVAAGGTEQPACPTTFPRDTELPCALTPGRRRCCRGRSPERGGPGSGRGRRRGCPGSGAPRGRSLPLHAAQKFPCEEVFVSTCFDRIQAGAGHPRRLRRRRRPGVAGGGSVPRWARLRPGGHRGGTGCGCVPFSWNRRGWRGRTQRQRGGGGEKGRVRAGSWDGQAREAPPGKAAPLGTPRASLPHWCGPATDLRPSGSLPPAQVPGAALAPPGLRTGSVPVGTLRGASASGALPPPPGCAGRTTPSSPARAEAVGPGQDRFSPLRWSLFRGYRGLDQRGGRSGAAESTAAAGPAAAPGPSRASSPGQPGGAEGQQRPRRPGRPSPVCRPLARPGPVRPRGRARGAAGAAWAGPQGAARNGDASRRGPD